MADDSTLRDYCLSAAAAAYPTSVPHKIAGVPLQHSQVLPSEMFLFASLSMAKRVGIVLESGRKNGYSTEVLCQWPHLWRVRSCDVQPSKERDDALRAKYQDLILAHADSRTMFARWVLVYKDAENVALLVDGPKDSAALDLIDPLLDYVVFAAVHDVMPGKEIWGKLLEREHFTTRDPEWVELFGKLDDPMLARHGYQSRAVMVSESMGLAILRGGRWDSP